MMRFITFSYSYLLVVTESPNAAVTEFRAFQTELLLGMSNV